jgi:hypothetical protein
MPTNSILSERRREFTSRKAFELEKPEKVEVLFLIRSFCSHDRFKYDAQKATRKKSRNQEFENGA